MIEAQRILVRAPNWTGDVVMATPGLRALRARFPDAHIGVHVRPGLEPLLAGAPWCDAVYTVRSYHRGLLALWREARSLPASDLGICLPDSFSSALLFRLAGIRPVVGYARNGRAALLDRPLPPPRNEQGGDLVARERHVLGLMEALGCDGGDTRLELFTTREEEDSAAAVLASAGVRPDEDFVVLAPGASYGSSKCWPPASFASVGDALGSRGVRVVITGSPGEAALCERVAAAMRTPGANLAGRLGLGALKALVRRARALVCNDAGTRHVAVAFGVPAVVMMGPTSLEKTNLNLEQVTVLTADDVACRPCYLRECPIDHRCMTRIEPARVLAAVEPALTPLPRTGSLA